MSNDTLSPELLLEKILNKAEGNGFSFRKGSHIESIEFIGMGRFDALIKHDDEEGGGNFEFHINELFFNHNFAKAFFGDQEVCSNCRNHLKGSDWKNGKCTKCDADLEAEDASMERWQWDISKLVLEEDILQYLIKYI